MERQYVVHQMFDGIDEKGFIHFNIANAFSLGGKVFNKLHKAQKYAKEKVSEHGHDNIMAVTEILYKYKKEPARVEEIS